MKITILTYGSRGDVQPFLPLSLKLMEAGHSVKLAAPSRFKNLVTEHNIDFIPLAGDPEDLSRRLNNAGRNFIKLLNEIMNHTTQIGVDVLHQTEEACGDADLILHTFLHAVGAHTFARKKGIPDIHIQMFPMFTPTGDYPNVTWPNWNMRSLNRFTHQVASNTSWWTARLGFERVRRQAGLPRRTLHWPFDDHQHRPRTPILCAWSPSVLPASNDWPSHVHVTGYYFFSKDHAYESPAELTSFLQGGESPICVTFGSMVNRDREQINRIVREALKQTKNRGIVLSGWSGVQERSSKDLLYLDAVPHDSLLPHCKMVIHHGGAGTTAAGLRAGIPNIVVPFMGDQRFWGDRVYAIGVGPQPILLKNLSVEKLAHAIVEADETMMHRRAQDIGIRIRNEDGTGEAVKWIQKYSNDSFRSG